MYILVAAGIGSRVHLMRILTQQCARGLQTDHAESNLKTSCTLPLVLHQHMHTVRQRPART